MSPDARIRLGWVLFVVSVIGWPVSALTIARQEPQIVLFLSFFAIWLTALDFISIEKARKEQKENGNGS